MPSQLRPPSPETLVPGSAPWRRRPPKTQKPWSLEICTCSCAAQPRNPGPCKWAIKAFVLRHACRARGFSGSKPQALKLTKKTSGPAIKPWHLRFLDLVAGPGVFRRSRCAGSGTEVLVAGPEVFVASGPLKLTKKFLALQVNLKTQGFQAYLQGRGFSLVGARIEQKIEKKLPALQVGLKTLGF